MIRIAITAFSLAALPAAAHHGWSEYDATKPLTLSGRIVESGYEHPHGHVRLETPGKTWHMVLAPPSRMEARGLPPEDLRKGNTGPYQSVKTWDTDAPAPIIAKLSVIVSLIIWLGIISCGRLLAYL